MAVNSTYSYLVAYITGMDNDTPDNITSTVFHSPKIVTGLSPLTNHEIVTKYCSVVNKDIKSVAIFGIKSNLSIDLNHVAKSLGESFGYDVVLNMACQKNTILNMTMSLYTKLGNEALNNMILPCVINPTTEITWSGVIKVD